MNETEMSIIALLAAIFGGCLAMVMRFVLSIGHRQNKIVERLIRVETFLETLGKEAFGKLHRDDDEYGLDYYCEKYVENDCDLPMEDWENVLAICNRRLASNTGGADTPYFILVKALATHKLMPYRKIK